MKAHLIYRDQASCFKGSRIRTQNAAGLGGYHELVSKDEFERLLQTDPDFCCKRCIKALRSGRFDR